MGHNSMKKLVLSRRPNRHLHYVLPFLILYVEWKSTIHDKKEETSAVYTRRQLQVRRTLDENASFFKCHFAEAFFRNVIDRI